MTGAEVQGRAGLGWLKGRLHRGPTGSKHERSHAKDWGGAQHHGHGDQLDVSDSAFSGGTQRDHHLQRGHLGEDCQRAYDFLCFSTSICALHLSVHALIVNVRKKEIMRDKRLTQQKTEGTKQRIGKILACKLLCVYLVN